MVATGASRLVSLLALALVAPSTRGSPPEACTGRLQGVLACGTAGHWNIEATVVRGERWTPGSVPTISMKEASTTAGPTQDQGTGVADLGALLDAGEGAIVTLVSGEMHLVAHRAVLSAASPVFTAMFRHGTLGANISKVGIPDLEGPVLRQLVGYLYTGRAPQLPSMARRLLRAADKYGVSGLKAACEQQVVAQLDLENAAAAAVLSIRHNCPTLREAAINFIRGHTREVMDTQGWEKATRRQPEDVAEILRLLAKPPPETSSPATAADPAAAPTTASAAANTSATAAESAAAPIAAPTAASAAAPQPTSCRQAPPPDAAAVNHFRSVTRVRKGELLIQAAKEGAVEDVRVLLAAGADTGVRDGTEWTALHWAADRGHAEVALCLLEAGAEVDARSFSRSTPLQVAADGGHAAVVRLLLAASADPNARDDYRNTALHWPARKGDAEVVAALVKAGADIEAQDRWGNTALDYARGGNHQLLVDLLHGKT